MANEKGVCAFCNRGDVGADVVGETLQADGLTVHHHCLVSAMCKCLRAQH